ncbi:MAG: DNA-3-methyladenine glycosylase 2 family protein [Pyrinomonadaceae bacterium]|nr:DNA-3-methyladenine glycosylase 2 family protein [Pyrinomonadaceae bacterium]
MKLLSDRSLESACTRLASKNPDFRVVINVHGTPPLWDKPESFASLIDIILGQQVSLASAKACFDKLEAMIGNITPDNYLELSDKDLRSIGFSRQKTSYGRNVARAINDGSLDLRGLRKLEDTEVRIELEKIKGIGRWTSDIYLLMAMLRPDVIPKGDLALHIAWQKLAGLDERPNADEFLETAEDWKPYRSVAARLLWHFYLSEIRPLKAEEEEI